MSPEVYIYSDKVTNMDEVKNFALNSKKEAYLERFKKVFEEMHEQSQKTMFHLRMDSHRTIGKLRFNLPSFEQVMLNLDESKKREGFSLTQRMMLGDK